MDSSAWDSRYAGEQLVWSTGPNVWVEEVCADLPVGRVLDIAAGEGRNALWLAGHGWEAVALDFSPVAVERSKSLAAGRLRECEGDFTAYVADARDLPALDGPFDLVLVVYLHLPAAERRVTLTSAAECLAPGGRLLVVGHDRDNLEHGVGGPQDAAILLTPGEVAADLEGSGLVVLRAETVERQVEPGHGQRTAALDTLVLAQRPHVR